MLNVFFCLLLAIVIRGSANASQFLICSGHFVLHSAMDWVSRNKYLEGKLVALLYALSMEYISKSYIDALVIRAIFAPSAHQPHPNLRGQGQGPLSAFASSDGGRPTRS